MCADFAGSFPEGRAASDLLVLTVGFRDNRVGFESLGFRDITLIAGGLGFRDIALVLGV